MAAAAESMVSDCSGIASDRNKAIAFALFKFLSLDPNKYPCESIRSSDIASLFSSIVQLSERNRPSNEDEIQKWVAFASSVPSETDACLAALGYLNEELKQKSVLMGNGLQPSEADILVFSAVHSCVSHLPYKDLQKFPNVLRWIDYIQYVLEIYEMIILLELEEDPTEPWSEIESIYIRNKEDFGGVFKKVVVNKPAFEPVLITKKKTSGDNKSTEPSGKDNAVNEKKKKAPEKETDEKDAECNISVLNIQIGIIRKASKHPSADSLLVEEIDLGDGNLRQVVSGLAKFYRPEDLINRRVILITNVKPGKLRDIVSSGLVLCASNEDHTVVDPLLPPEGALLGERISFSGYDGKPEDVLNPKKKQLEKITPHLYTDDKGVATFKGIPFMTSAGPCTSSIPNANVK